VSTKTPPTKPSPLPIAEFAAELYERHRALDHSEATFSLLRRTIDRLWRIGVRTTADLEDADLVERFIAAGPAGERPSTRDALLLTLRTMCGDAHKAGRIASVPPFPHILHSSRRAAAAKRDLSRTDVEAVLAHLRRGVDTWEGQRTYVLAAVAVGTGLRVHRELLPLEWEDVDLEAGTIRVRRRDRDRRRRRGGPRTVAIPPWLLADLRAWRGAADSGFVFPTRDRSAFWYGGRNGSKPTQVIAAAGVAAGVGGVSLDALGRFHRDHVGPVLVLDLGPRPIPALSVAAPTPVELPPRRDAPAALTDGDATRLMAHLLARSAGWEGHRTFAAIGLVLLTGLPPRTILDLKVEEFDRGGTIRPGGEGPPLQLAPEAAAILAGWLDREDQVITPWIFPGAMLLGPWENSSPEGGNLRARLGEAALEAGLGPVTSVSLRRFHRSRGGRVILGEEYHATPPPAPFLTGPKGWPYVPGARREPPGYLQGPGEPVLIGGKEKPPLKPNQYLPISLMVDAEDAEPRGLSLGELDGLCKDCSPGWRQTLRRLMKQDPDYGPPVLMFPGTPWGRYRCTLARRPGSYRNLQS
jgi:integrase